MAGWWRRNDKASDHVIDQFLCPLFFFFFPNIEIIDQFCLIRLETVAKSSSHLFVFTVASKYTSLSLAGRSFKKRVDVELLKQRSKFLFYGPMFSCIN